VPRFCICQQCRVLPEIRTQSARLQAVVQGCVIEKECIIRLPTTKMCLVDQLPTQNLQDGLDERLLQALLTSIVFDPITLFLPEFGQSA